MLVLLNLYSFRKNSRSPIMLIFYTLSKSKITSLNRELVIDHSLNTYLCNFRLYHRWCIQQKIKDIYSQEMVKNYLVYRVENGAKWQTMNTIYSAMRKLFKKVLEIEWSFPGGDFFKEMEVSSVIWK